LKEILDNSKSLAQEEEKARRATTKYTKEKRKMMGLCKIIPEKNLRVSYLLQRSTTVGRK
jgi:hypothetical protein